MPKKFNSIEDRRKYMRLWYSKNKDRKEVKLHQRNTALRIREERKSWFQDLKANLKCEHCSNSDHRVLDFHHLDPSMKDMEVSNMVRLRWSKQKIINEMAKCICLCSNCHRILHWEERNSLSE